MRQRLVIAAVGILAVLCGIRTVAPSPVQIARPASERVFARAPAVDPAVLQIASTLSPGAPVIGAIAVDLDHDGDLDIVATTRDGFAFWTNEGDHFTRRAPGPPASFSASPGLAGRGDDATEPSVLPQSTVAQARLTKGPVVNPPQSVGRLTATEFRLDAVWVPGVRSGRAPPLLS